jgi:hypothetical protein
MCWYALTSAGRGGYVMVWLPGLMLVGVGIGLAFPVLGAAAVSNLPADRFAVGSAINQTCRQFGGALGVAALVAVLGKHTTGPDALGAFRHLWTFSAIMATLTGACSLLLPRAPTSTGVRTGRLVRMATTSPLDQTHA